MQLTLYTFLIFFLAVHDLNAQMQTWKWREYNMKFEAPLDFNISESSASKFNAGNGKLHLTIFPSKGTVKTEDELKSLLRTWAYDQNIKFYGSVNYLANLNRYWGFYIDGTASNGLPTSLLTLIDPDFNNIIFYVWLQYEPGYLNTAVAILKSFVPN